MIVIILLSSTYLIRSGAGYIIQHWLDDLCDSSRPNKTGPDCGFLVRFCYEKQIALVLVRLSEK